MRVHTIRENTLCAHARVHMRACIFAYACMFLCNDMRACTRMYVCISCMHTCTYKHLCIQIHTCVCVSVCICVHLECKRAAWCWRLDCECAKFQRQWLALKNTLFELKELCKSNKSLIGMLTTNAKLLKSCYHIHKSRTRLRLPERMKTTWNWPAVETKGWQSREKSFS